MQINTVDSINQVKKFCNENFRDKNPFISYEFFELLEKTNCTVKSKGWIPEHIIIKDKNKLIGLIPNFRKLNSYGEFVFDQIFENAFYQIGKDYFPKFLSAIPFTPVTRNNFLYHSHEVNDAELFSKLKVFLQKKKISSFHINFIDKIISTKLKKYFHQRVGIQYHWKNNKYKSFDHFLSHLKSRKKKNILKERKFIEDKNIKFTIKVGNDINDVDLLNLYQCYAHTINKKWSQEYLTKEFFLQLLNSNLIKDTVLISASLDSKFVGCSVHFKKNKNLYGRYWGALQEIPNLHFELCYYQAIEYAILNDLELVEAGAQGEHKISRGYLPVKTFSCHWFNNDVLDKPISNFLMQEEQKVINTLNYLENNLSPFNDK
jgi:predicted N-acyltransferase